MFCLKPNNVSLHLLTYSYHSLYLPSVLFFGLVLSCSVIIVMTPGLLWADQTVLTLQDAVEIALSASPTVKVKQAELTSARQTSRAVKGRLFPQVNAYVGYSRLSDPVAVVPIKGFGGNLPYFSKDLYRSGINLTLPIYQGGRLRADLKKSDLEEKAQEKSLKSFKEDLVAQVTNAFYSILYLSALLDAKNTTLSALNTQRENAHLALKLGRIAPLDLMEIDTQIASQRQEIVGTREALSRMHQHLATLLGLSPLKAFEVKGDLELEGKRLFETMRFILESDELALCDKAMDELIDQRADIQQAERQLRAAEQALKAAKALHLPSLELVGDYGRRAGWGFTGDEEVWSLGINLNLNIFSGGAISAKVAQAQARLAAARQRLRSLRLQASSQILSAISSFKEAVARLELSRSVQDTAYEAYRIEKLKYEKGAGTVTDMLKAQAAWDQAKDSMIRALYDRVSALTALRLYTGRTLL